MDLLTVHQKLNSPNAAQSDASNSNTIEMLTTELDNGSSRNNPGNYPTLKSFLQDLDLIWRNSKLYNSDLAAVNACAKFLEEEVFDFLIGLNLTKEEVNVVKEMEKASHVVFIPEKD